MNYSRHRKGLLLAVLSSDCPAQGALDYVTEHNLPNWRDAEKQILRNLDVAIAYVKVLKQKPWPELHRLLNERITNSTGHERMSLVISELLYHHAIGSFYRA